MKTRDMTDEQVEQEIARLTKSPYVRLARVEHQIRYRRRKYLSELKGLEKRGMELERQGFCAENFEDMLQDLADEKDYAE